MDNFDLQKFLKESKALENLNPTLKSINESHDNLRAKIKEMIVTELEGESSNNEKIKTKYNEMFGKNPQTTFKDVAKALNLPEDEVGMVLQGGDFMFKEETDIDLMDPLMEEDEEDLDPETDWNKIEEDLEEAKKKKDEEVEDIDVTDTEDISTEDIPTEDEMPAEDTPESTGGLEDIAADMKGTEADLMDHLMKSFQIAKGMGNEKLERTISYFRS